MPNYEDLKKKAKDAIDTIADISVEAYKIAEEKARVIARRTKLNTEITRDKALIRRLKMDIGARYYDLHKGDAEEMLKESCDDITAALDRIEARRAEIEELKSSGTDSCCCCEDDADEACCAEEACEAEPAEAEEACEAEAAGEAEPEQAE